MSTPQTMVKGTIGKDIQRRPEPPPIPAGAGRALGEATSLEVTPDRIRLRAYEIYQARNGGPGDADSDWALAERELTCRSESGPSGEDTIADPVVLEVTSRSTDQRQPAAFSRDGL